MVSVAGVLDVDRTLAARWSLGFEDLALLNTKPAGTRLGLAAQLLMYRVAGRFAGAASEFAEAAITYLAEQVEAAVADLADYDWLGRSGRRHRAEILAHLGFRRARQRDMRDAAAWTGSELCPLGLPASGMMERLLGCFGLTLMPRRCGQQPRLRRTARKCGAHSDDCSHRFRLKPAMCSNRSQPGIPMIPAG